MPASTHSPRATRAFRISALALATLTSCLTQFAPDDQVGPVPDDLKPLLLYYQDEDDRGTPAPHGFVITRPGAGPLALTAYHVAGSSGGSTWLRNPLDPSLAIRLGQRVSIAGAAVIGATGSQRDLAAFRVTLADSSLALELATSRPQVGDTVYVLSVHLVDASNPHPLGGPRRHMARVDVSHESAFVYTYLGSANSNFTSGAAVLNRDGDVVGVNVGTRVMTAGAWDAYRQQYAPCCAVPTQGEVVGLAVHVGSIRQLLGMPGLSGAAR